MAGKKTPTSRVAQLEKESLKRVLGVSDLFAIGYGDLGSSIYYALGVTALYALGATPIALLLAGFIFVCTALSYAEMTSMFQESGGSASFARHAFNDVVSFIAGWGLLLDYIVTIAISAFAVGPYLSYFFHDLKITAVQIGFSITLIGLLFVMNLIGIRQSTRVSFVLVGFTILIQGIIILIGMGWLFDFSYFTEHLRINVANANWSPTWPEFWKGTAMAMVAYTGIESIAQLGAEAKKPKVVPKAVFITMAVLLFMYLGISAVAFSAITPQDLGTKYILDPIAGIVNALPFGGQFLAPWVGLLAGALLLVAANAGLIGASRLSYNMGEYYQLPRFFFKLHPRFRTPHAALAFFAILASLIVLASRGSLIFLADLYNFGAQLAFFFANLSVIVMRIKKPNDERPFTIPLNIKIKGYSIPITAVIGCIATCGVWILVVITKPEGRYLGFSWMAIGITMFLIFRSKKRLSAGKLEVEKIKIPEYKQLGMKNILVPISTGTQVESLQMACAVAKLHDAKITFVTVMEIPASLPLDIKLPHRIALSQAILNRAEAIAREHNIDVEPKLMQSRSSADVILNLILEEKYDLIVLGSLKSSEEAGQRGIGAIAERISREASCRVLVMINNQGLTEEILYTPKSLQ